MKPRQTVASLCVKSTIHFSCLYHQVIPPPNQHKRSIFFRWIFLMGFSARKIYAAPDIAVQRHIRNWIELNCESVCIWKGWAMLRLSYFLNKKFRLCFSSRFSIMSPFTCLWQHLYFNVMRQHLVIRTFCLQWAYVVTMYLNGVNAVCVKHIAIVKTIETKKTTAK